MPIQYQAEYIQFIVSRGVGANDRVASSVDSYISYLSSVSHHLGVDISPDTLNCEGDVQRLAHALEGVRRPRTIGNYVSAMRQYVAMVHELGSNLNSNLAIANDLVALKEPRHVPNASEPDQNVALPKVVHQDLEAFEVSLACEELNSEESDGEDVDDDEQEYGGVTEGCDSDDKHFLHSSFREKLLEHLFVAELLKRSWREHSCDLEIAKPEVDSKGYDLIAENKGIVRHIQLKSTKRGGNAAAQNIHSALALKPSGCVVWLEFDELTLELGPFRFLGGAPGAKLPSLADYPIAKHTKANSEGKKTERPQLRRVKKSNFELVAAMDELYRVLFG